VPAFSNDLLGTMLIALVSSTALLVALWKLRDLRRLDWLRGRITDQRRPFGPMRDSGIDVPTTDGA
jgi:hypothetical protein